MIKSVIQYKHFHWANTAKTSPIRIFSVLAPIPVSPITARSEPLDVSTFARKSPERYWTG